MLKKIKISILRPIFPPLYFKKSITNKKIIKIPGKMLDSLTSHIFSSRILYG